MAFTGRILDVYVIEKRQDGWYYCKLKLLHDNGDMSYFTSNFFGRPEVGQRFTLMGDPAMQRSVIEGTARPMPPQLGEGGDTDE